MSKKDIIVAIAAIGAVCASAIAVASILDRKDKADGSEIYISGNGNGESVSNTY